jgi:hypothetical protein
LDEHVPAGLDELEGAPPPGKFQHVIRAPAELLLGDVEGAQAHDQLPPPRTLTPLSVEVRADTSRPPTWDAAS